MSLAPEIKIAEQRLSVLELAKALGNVSAACKQRDIVRELRNIVASEAPEATELVRRNGLV
jgi:hypothetical protein